jgi:putative hydrolase of the HAD superfamily
VSSPRRRAVPTRAVLLDALGTLVALEPPGPLLAAGLRESHGIELSSEQAAQAFAVEIAYYRAHHLEARDEASLAALRGRCAEVLHSALPPRAARGVTTAELRAAMEGALRFSAYPDALGALALLRAQGRRLVVVSNWDVSLPAVLAATGVASAVDGVLSSARVGAAKPDPAIFHAALALAGVAAEQAVHVGDSPLQDVEGAKAAGVAAVLLRRADTPGAPDASGSPDARGTPGTSGAQGSPGTPGSPRAGTPDASRARTATISSLAELPALLT